MQIRVIALLTLSLGCAHPVAAATAVDPAVVGTWKLEWPRPDLFWSVRSDGVYRMHGPGANPRQVGRLEAGQGRFSMRSPVWIDSGTYRLGDPNTLVITGQLGPGTWRRVWSPAAKGPDPTPGAGGCSLFAENDVARFLSAPVAAAMDPRGSGECVYQSQLSSFDSVNVRAYPARRQAWFTTRKVPKPSMISVPGVGEDAYVEQSGAGPPVLNILHGQDQFRIRFNLTPEAAADDVPAVMELARAAGRRLGP